MKLSCTDSGSFFSQCNFRWWFATAVWLVATAVLIGRPLWIVYRSNIQKTRKYAALICVLILPISGVCWVFGGWESNDAALFWILLSLLQIAVCGALAWLHLRQIKKDVKEYFKDFKYKSESDVSVEGQSSFIVIVWGIYGLAALLGSVFLYFAIAQAWKPETFIFKNNEGFIAALALLIIVISGAAVPIYTDLAKQVRQQIETFQLQISELNRAVTNISQHTLPLWTHFESVSSAAIRTWSKRLKTEDVGQASYDLLLKPFSNVPDGFTFDKVSDEYFLRYQKISVPGPSNQRAINLLFKGKGFNQAYLVRPDLELSKERIRNNQIFSMPVQTATTPDPDTPPTPDREILISERWLRARRLRYLGWLAQGQLGIAFSKSKAGWPLWFAPTKYPALPLSRIDKPEEPDATTRTSLKFQGDSLRLVPATEDWMVAVLNIQSDEQTDPINQLAEEFRSRAARHIKRWNDVMSSKLVAICDPLDIDIAVFADDMYLLEQLAMKYEEPDSVGVNARFLYYGFWLNAVSERETAVAKILAILKKPEAAETDIKDVREELNKIRKSIGDFITDKGEKKDPISNQQYFSTSPEQQLSRRWNLLVSQLGFRPSWEERLAFEKLSPWLAEVEQIGPQEGAEPQRTTVLVQKFLRWLVRVLGNSEQNMELESKSDSDLLILAFGLISPYFKHQRDQMNLLEADREPLSDEDSEKKFQEITKKVWDYCTDEKNAVYLQKTFFIGRHGKIEAHENYTFWLEEFKKRKITKQGSQNLTEEFLLLTLADHKSALFNWLRAARSVETRERVHKFQKKLTKKPVRQLGIEVVPSRQDCLIYLREYLEVAGHQKSMRLRSIYDLQPTETEKKEIIEEDKRWPIYRSYIDILNFLWISKRFRENTALSEQIQAWLVKQIVPQEVVDPLRLSELDETNRKFLRWLVRVLGNSQQNMELESKSDDELLKLAFGLISPYFKHQRDQMNLLEADREPLSDEDSEKKFQEITKKVWDYCTDEKNAVYLQKTFFGGDNKGSKADAATNFNNWLIDFKEKRNTEQSDNDNQ